MIRPTTVYNPGAVYVQVVLDAYGGSAVFEAEKSNPVGRLEESPAQLKKYWKPLRVSKGPGSNTLLKLRVEGELGSTGDVAVKVPVGGTSITWTVRVISTSCPSESKMTASTLNEETPVSVSAKQDCELDANPLSMGVRGKD
jgi:hypothetical protein